MKKSIHWIAWKQNKKDSWTKYHFTYHDYDPLPICGARVDFTGMYHVHHLQPKIKDRCKHCEKYYREWFYKWCKK